MNDWFYAKNGQQNGPVKFEQLRDLARSGGLDAKDLVWNSSMKDWTPAGQVEGIFSAASAADPSNPYAAPQSDLSEPAPSSGSEPLSEIAPGSEPLDPTACIKRGFELTKRKFGDILLIGVVYFAIFIAAGVIMGLIDSALGIGGTTTHSTWHMGDGNMTSQTTHMTTYTTRTPSPLNSVVTNVLSIFLSLGLTRIALNLVSGKSVSVSMLFGEGRKLLRAIGASILFGLMVALGLLLLIVPGIYLALRYGQFLNAIVDRDMGIMEAFSYSSSLTTNNKLQLLVLWLLTILVILAGALACGIGLIFAAPVAWLSWIVAYRWMQYGHRATLDQPGTEIPMLYGR